MLARYFVDMKVDGFRSAMDLGAQLLAPLTFADAF